MHLRTADNKPVVLGYCANVHPGESLPLVLDAVRRFGAGVRAELGVESLSFGLWLSRLALSELELAGISELRGALEGAGLFVCTLNGFPYGNFQQDVVKRRVYHPDLGTQARRDYLFGLARVLSQLLPSELGEGTISTLPIGHRDEAPSQTRAEASERAARMLCGLCEDLARLRDQTGRAIRICLEPEPGCWLETTADALAFFCDVLPLTAAQLGCPSELLATHLGVCYDTCHQAVCFEDAASSVRAFAEAGIRIGKAQLSSALEISEPADPTLRAELMRFDEPRYLHQVRTRGRSSQLLAADDLPQAGQLPSESAWRVHFHVPIQRALLGRIATTRGFLEQALRAFGTLPELPQLEVETYTWNVLPEAERPSDDAALVQNLAAELRWARAALP